MTKRYLVGVDYGNYNGDINQSELFYADSIEEALDREPALFIVNMRVAHTDAEPEPTWAERWIGNAGNR
jgi:hypothetical protein